MMKYLAILILLVVTPAFAAKGKFKDDQMIRDLSSVFWENWNRHEVKGIAALFHDDVTYLTAYGKITSGKKETEKMLKEDHEGIMKDVTGNSEIKSIQFVARNVAILDEEVEVTGWKNLDGKTIEGLTKVHSTSVLLKKSGKWLVSVRRAWLMPAPRETASY